MKEKALKWWESLTPQRKRELMTGDFKHRNPDSLKEKEIILLYFYRS